jgi:hypothetical protein
MEAYDDALKKHGIKTLLGSLTDLLDPKVLTAAAAAGMALSPAGHAMEILLGSGIVIGNAVLKILTRQVDMSDALKASRGEIACVFEMRKRFTAPR